MKSLEELIRRNLIVILLLMLLGGFVMLLAELLITGHVEGVQNVAVIASIVGAIGVIAGFFIKGVVRHVVVLVLLVLTLSGLMGVREHSESSGRIGDSMRFIAAADLASGYQLIANVNATTQKPLRDEDEDENKPNQRQAERESSPPPLAPLSLSGLALMGAVVLLAKQDE